MQSTWRYFALVLYKFVQPYYCPRILNILVGFSGHRNLSFAELWGSEVTLFISFTFCNESSFVVVEITDIYNVFCRQF